MSDGRCIDCGEVVDPHARGTLFEVTGFARKREQGGTNHVRFPETTGRVLCAECATRRTYGLNPRQEEMTL